MSDSNWKRNVKDFVAGCAGGVAQVLTGQPFDIVKVRQATMEKPMGVMAIWRKMISTEGPLALYKGTLPPILGVGACVSIQFGVKENTSRVLKAYNKGEDLSLKQHFLCGATGGVANSIVSTPAEGMRIIMQTQGKTDPRGDPHYANSIECTKTVYRNHGLGGIYRGQGINAMREFFTYGTWFSTYEFVLSKIAPADKPRSECPKPLVVFAGGLAGYAYWGLWYPIDITKSKIQADSYANPRYSSILDCVKQTLKSEGIAGFYKGFTPCMLRAFPASSATFLVYEMVMNILGRD